MLQYEFILCCPAAARIEIEAIAQCRFERKNRDISFVLRTTKGKAENRRRLSVLVYFLRGGSDHDTTRGGAGVRNRRLPGKRGLEAGVVGVTRGERR